ncbi:MAG: SpoIIE family protein phosphatase [Clostridia bacterium]|nr:SpoIIE family protein phosphatase [Clostridia bacterium]
MSHLMPVIDALSDMVRIVSREGRILYTNKAYDRRVAYGQPSTGQLCYALYGRTTSCENCVTCESGAQRGQVREFNDRRYSVNVTPLLGEDGEMMAIMEVFRDISLESAVRSRLMEQDKTRQRDLFLANKLQSAFTKLMMPDVPGYMLAADYQPCERVGGDMFDCIQFGDKLVMYVADVSGHGIPASMLSIFFARSVDTACKLGLDTPQAILGHVQEEFTELQVDDDLYITGFVAVLDQPSGRLQYSNAGLSVTPVIAHEGCVRELFQGAMPICLWSADRRFRQSEDCLEPGDRLLLYTDGIPEVQTDEAAQSRFYDLFSAEPFTASEFFYKVRRDFITHKQDDLTMLVLEREQEPALPLNPAGPDS